MSGSASRLYSYTGSPIGIGADMTVDQLFTFTVPANTLSEDGASLHILAAGGCTKDASVKQVSLSMGGYDISAMNIDPNAEANWRLDTWITRTGPQAFIRQKSGWTSGGKIHFAVNQPSPADVDWTKDVVFEFWGQNQTQALLDSITGTNFLVMLWP